MLPNWFNWLNFHNLLPLAGVNEEKGCMNNTWFVTPLISETSLTISRIIIVFDGMCEWPVKLFTPGEKLLQNTFLTTKAMGEIKMPVLKHHLIGTFVFVCLLAGFSSSIWGLGWGGTTYPWIRGLIFVRRKNERDSGSHQLLLSWCHTLQVKPVHHSSGQFYQSNCI